MRLFNLACVTAFLSGAATAHYYPDFVPRMVWPVEVVFVVICLLTAIYCRQAVARSIKSFRQT